MGIRDSRLTHTPGGAIAKRRRRRRCSNGHSITTYEVDASVFKGIREGIVTEVQGLLEMALRAIGKGAPP